MSVPLEMDTTLKISAQCIRFIETAVYYRWQMENDVMQSTGFLFVGFCHKLFVLAGIEWCSVTTLRTLQYRLFIA